MSKQIGERIEGELIVSISEFNGKEEYLTSWGNIYILKDNEYVKIDNMYDKVVFDESVIS